jgi:hypothetical protein
MGFILILAELLLMGTDKNFQNKRAARTMVFFAAVPEDYLVIFTTVYLKNPF